MTLRADIEAALSGILRGRPVILVGRLPQTAESQLPVLDRVGAGPFLRVSLRGGPGTNRTGMTTHVLLPGPADPDFVIDVARLEALLRDPPPTLRRVVSDFDPGETAVVIASSHVDCDALLGRPRPGRRSEASLALEDKTRVDHLWSGLDVPHCPHRVVPVERAALVRAANVVDQGHGTVWAGDNTLAVEGGALATRWVHDTASQEAAVSLLGPRCRTARVMPFLPGLPVSIHAWVLPRGVAVISPMEMVVLRHRESGAFRFCGVATTWHPDEATTHKIRSVARTVAHHLHGTGYRGALSIDGVITKEGFRPTEINARFPAGLSRLARHTDGLPLALLDMLVRDGTPLDISPARLQAVLRGVFERRPFTWLHTATPRAPSMPHSVPLHWTGQSFRRARTGEPASSSLLWEPAAAGGAVQLDVPAPPRGVTGARLLTQAFQAAGPPLSTQMAGWRGARPPR